MSKNVIFDLDGTIIDSSECIYGVYSALFGEINIKMPEGKEKRRLIGPPVETSLKALGVEDIPFWTKRFREIYATVDLKSTNKLYDGISTLLDCLRSRGCAIFIATSKSERFALKILDCLGVKDKFDAIYGSRDEIGRSKKSEVLEALISDCALKKEECILIGDTAFDVEGAEKTGIKVAIVTYGFGEADDFRGRNIEFFADKPMEIADLMRYNNG